MEKKLKLIIPWSNSPGVRKMLLYMKLTSVIFLVAVLQTWAAVSYSQTATLSINLKNAPVQTVLQQVEDQSEFYFLYSRSVIDVDRTVDVQVKNAKINEVLNVLFSGSDVAYKVDGRQIVLSKKSENSVLDSQQQKSVSGKVTDNTGAGLPGVSVVVKGTTNGTISDANGNYSLSNVAENAVVQFSFIGMAGQEVAVGNKTSVNVTMEEETIGIEEVVAVGYGTVRKRDLTGSVVSVSGGLLKDIPVSSVSQAITGRMAGVQVTKTDGAPDAEIKIRVRGGGSLTQDNSPLFIVDGFPVDNINDIAPTDIASIDVLKDASSTAIYGARGANGVILVTTKGGFEGKGKVSYNTYFGLKEVTKKLEVLNPYEYVYKQYEHSQYTFEKLFGDFRDIDLYKQMKGSNWQDEIFGRTGTNMYHNLAFTGGTNTSKYNISLTRNDEEEVMIESGMKRTNLNINTSNSVKKWLKIDLNIRLSDSEVKGGGTSGGFSQLNRLMHILTYRPVQGLSSMLDNQLIQDNAGILNSFSFNPLLQTKDDYRRAKQTSFYYGGAANIQLHKNLAYRLEYGRSYGQNGTKRFYGLNTPNVVSFGYQPIASTFDFNINTYRLANTLTYSKRDFIPGSNITVLLGEEINHYKSSSKTNGVYYLPKYIDVNSAFGMLNLGKTDPIVVSDNPASRVSSFFGRLNYDYKGRYLLTATFRADGSSKFAKGNQWGYFPSLALAWRITDEKFIKPTENWLSNLKLRTSYGEVGNNRISDFAWIKTFSVQSGSLFIDGDGTSTNYTPYLVPNSILHNKELKWETTITRNGGIDFGLFKERLSGSVELYKNTTRDLLISATIPSFTGYSSQWQNIGQVSNRGLELTLNGVVYDKKDFKLSMSFNIAFNKNRIDKLGETKEFTYGSSLYNGSSSGDFYINEGGQIGQMYGYVTDGMYSFDDFNYANGTYTLKEGVANNSAILLPARFWPGTLKFKDQNGDFKVDPANDRVVIGNSNPKHTGGFNITAQYKGFDFSTFFNWVYGNDILNLNKLAFTSEGPFAYRNQLNIMNSDSRFIYFDKTTGDLVSEPDKLAALNKNTTIWSMNNSYSPVHSWAIEDGSFLRLNTVTIGYSLPKSILSRLKIDSLRLYASAYNIWRWTNYTGYDPEVDTQTSTPLTPGIDWGAYPKNRSVNFGLNVEF